MFLSFCVIFDIKFLTSAMTLCRIVLERVQERDERNCRTFARSEKAANEKEKKLNLNLPRSTLCVIFLSKKQTPPSTGQRSPFHAASVVAASAAPTSQPEAAPSNTKIDHPAPLPGAEIRRRFLSFYEGKGHTKLPSSSLIPEDPTVLLTIAGMLQFKPVFLGQAPRPNGGTVSRATTSQRCIRTNDIENVGVTARHHTYFEMLGNFSFGDYFKREAIAMAWKLSTEELGIPGSRIWASVFRDDDEVAEAWCDPAIAGLPPHRVQRLGEEDNFWAAGPTGPCGPCSELYYDLHPERGIEGADLGDDSRFIEFYNLVFMESNRGSDGKLTPLTAKNIDTGMGLERVAQILQGVPNNYETDLIYPLVEAAARAAGVDYKSSDTDEKTRTSLKVIGDHARAAAHLVADGVTPSNVGRGYVLRRLIRRTVMKARLLGVKGGKGDPLLLPQLAAVAAEVAAAAEDSTLPSSLSRVQAELSREEERFSATLDAGGKLLNDALNALEKKKKKKDGGGSGKEGQPLVLPGATAFELNDTFGFPLEVTQEACADRGATIDVAGFEKAMEDQRTRSKEGAKVVDVTAAASLGGLAAEVGATRFVGYDSTEAGGCAVKALLSVATASSSAGNVDDDDEDSAAIAAPSGAERLSSAPAGTVVDVVLDATPFYAEGGGQVGDAGELSWGEGREGGRAVVLDTRRAAGGAVSLHRCRVTRGELSVGDVLSARVDPRRRSAAAAHHTATHLLQAALKSVLGEDVGQQGSLVQPGRLRFDFNLPRGMEPDEISRVEALINGWVSEDSALQTETLPLAAARERGAVAAFGEKYDASGVRVVDVPGVSMELCGGTHVRSTGQIGGFKVLSESGVASGVRRVEAVVGGALVEHLNAVDSVVRSLSGSLSAKPSELPARVAALQDELRAAQKEVAAMKSQVAATKALDLASTDAVVRAGKGTFLAARLDGVEGKALQEAAAALLSKLDADPAAVFLISASDSGAVMAATASAGAVKAGIINAGKFVGGVAKICGGGGGGKPNMAQAGGKDASAVPKALESAKELLAEAFQ